MSNLVKMKVMVFVVRSLDPNWLILRNYPDPEHGGDKWFVVTGGVENGETLEQAAKQEVLEETALKLGNLHKIISIKHSYRSNYHPGITFVEQAFLGVVANDPVILNEEHTDYKWVELDDFLKELYWTDDKIKLRKVLESEFERITNHQ